MQGRFTPNFQDIREAQAALAGKQFTPPNSWRDLFGWAIFLALVVMLILLLTSSPIGHRLVQSLITGDSRSHRHLTIGLTLLSIGTVSLFFIWFVVFRRFRLLHPSWKQGSTAIVTTLDDGIALECDGIRLEMTWACFDRFSETPRLFILHERPNRIRVIPKIAFATDADQNQFRQHLVANLPAPPQVRPL